MIQHVLKPMSYIESVIINGGTVLQEGRLPSVVLIIVFFYSCVQLSVMSDNETSVRVEVCLTVFLMKHYKTGNDEEIIKQKSKTSSLKFLAVNS